MTDDTMTSYERFSLDVLEFPVVISRLAGATQSSLGYELASELEPSPDVAEVMRRLDYTDDARQFFDRERAIPTFQGMHDIREEIARAGKGGILGPGELYRINASLKAIRSARKVVKEAQFEYPQITREAQRLGVFPEIEDALDNAIHPDGEVLDRASSELRRIRREMNVERERAERMVAGMIANFSKQGYLRETVFTMKNGRYVLPFRQDCQKNVRAIVQARSSTGGTVFLEPYELVERNNRLSELKGEEDAEVTRILTELSSLVGSRASEIRSTLGTAAFLDFAFACGRLSRDWKGTRAELSDKVVIKAARHPMIPSIEVVPVDISFPDESKALILSGPNAGGKTVALKTMGLFALINQAGLHIPAHDSSELPVFGSVHADIGDLQSIEWNLSSFSAHIVFIKRMFESMETEGHLPALVLLDEIGRSTDPQEGSALSLAVIEKLLGLPCFTAVTTHLPAIKNLVLSSDPRVAGASVEFDIENAKPLYTIRVGTLGASYAIAIARRLGLDADVLRRAEALILEGGDILKIDMPALEHRLEELERSVAHAKSAKERAQREFGSFVLMERLIVLAALKQAEKITSQAEKKLESALKMASALPHQIDKHEVNEDLVKIREYANRLRRAADALSSPVLASSEASQGIMAESKKAGVEIGSQVWVLTLRREGELVEMGPKRATVIIGGKRMQVPMDQVQPLEPQDASKGKVLKTHTPPQKSLPLFIDLHGMTVEDAIHVLEPYLDEAFYQGREHAHVIHGFGTGALRKGIHEFLQKHPQVASFEFADVNEGGAGVTIVKLKRGK